MDKPNVEVLRVLYYHRKHILLTTIIASLLALGISYAVKPKFRSMAYVYPANMVPFFMEQQNKSISHTELLLQFFNSYDVRKDVLKKFRLDRHYNLDTLDPKFQTYFNYAFEENVVVKQTKYESIELTILDTDPDTAQKIASAMIESVNNLISKQHIKKFNEYVNVNRAYLNTHRKSLDSLQACMEEFTKKYGLVDMGSQMREISKNYYKLLSEGKGNAKLDEAFSNLTIHGPEFFRLGNSFSEEARLYATVENELSKSIRDFSRNLTYMIIASEPTKPDVKYWPKRGVIVIITAISSLLLCCLYFAYADRMKEVFASIKTPPTITK
jgi:LPS O-antigen subunit length determinant protein (WzzB/FepE family)